MRVLPGVADISILASLAGFTLGIILAETFTGCDVTITQFRYSVAMTLTLYTTWRRAGKNYQIRII